MDGRLRRWIAAAVAAAVVLLAAPGAASAIVLPAGFETEEMASGFTRPMAVDWTPDGRMLVAEKDGVLKVVPSGATTGATVLDIRAEVNSHADRGLLGLAVDAQFATNRYVYLLYTREIGLTQDSANPMVSRLERVQLSPGNVVSNRTAILGTDADGPCPVPTPNTDDCIPSEGDTHSIGTVRAAPDGTLYVGSGDAAGYGGVEPLAFRTYDTNTMAGKVLRVDRNGNGVGGHPFCPSDANLTHTCTKIFALGFRNPFRFALRADGRLNLGDVGWESREELDLVESGRGYGWPCYEGSIRTPQYRDEPQCSAEYAKEGTANAHRPPLYDYDRSGEDGAAVGGPEYTGDAYPAGYRNTIFVGDYARHFIKRVQLNSSGGVAAVHDFATAWSGVALEEGPAGDLVIVDPTWFGDESGVITRVRYSPGNTKPVAAINANPRFGAAVPLQVSFSGLGSNDPDGDTLSYTWDFGDGSQGSGASPTHTYTTAGTYTARVTVDDGRGKTDTKTIRIDVGNEPPVATIGDGTSDSYRGGQVVHLEGTGSDPQGDTPALKWTVLLVHGGHTHGGPQPTGATASFTATNDHDADSHYMVTLTATDNKGLTTSDTKRVDPETANLAIRSTPTGAPVTYAGTEYTAPYESPAAIGFLTTVSAAQEFTAGGRRYSFRSWSDGGARLHDFAVPATATALTARYADVSPLPAPKTTPKKPTPKPLTPPRLRFDTRKGVNARRGILRGRVLDTDGVGRVHIGLGLRSGKRCRWWREDLKRLAARGSSCAKPHLIRARVRRLGPGSYAWSLNLRKRLPAGRWLVAFRSTDGPGAVSTELESGRSSAAFRVKKAAPRRRR